MEEVKVIKVYRLQSEFTSEDGRLLRVGPVTYSEGMTLEEFKLFVETPYFISRINEDISRVCTLTPEIEQEWRNNLIIQELT